MDIDLLADDPIRRRVDVLDAERDLQDCDRLGWEFTTARPNPYQVWTYTEGR